MDFPDIAYFSFEVYNGTALISHTSGAIFETYNTWHHIAVVAQAGFRVKFIRDNYDITIQNVGPIYTGDFKSSIYDATMFADNLYFEGYLDNIQIYRKALNYGEIRYLSSYGNTSLGIINPTLPDRDSDGDQIGDYCGMLILPCSLIN